MLTDNNQKKTWLPPTYDLRFKDLPANFKDAFIGASRTDEPSITRMKKKMACQLFVYVGAVILLSLFLFLFS